MRRALVASLLLALPGAGAHAADEHPRRRAGLWEVETASAQAAGLPAVRQCVDEHTDGPARHLDRVVAEQGACRHGAFRREGASWAAESVCRESRGSVRSRSVVTGDLASAYRIDTTVTYDPPLGGVRREESTATTGRWLGPCGPDQKAGDLIIPGMGRINMVDGNVQAQPERPPRRSGERPSPGR